jgi:hypothetical protein
MSRSLNYKAAAEDDLAVLYNINTGQKIKTFPKNSCGLSEYGRHSSSP